MYMADSGSVGVFIKDKGDTLLVAGAALQRRADGLVRYPNAIVWGGRGWRKTPHRPVTR